MYGAGLTLGKVVGLTGAFRGLILGFPADAAATAPAFSCAVLAVGTVTTAAGAVTLSVSGRLAVASFLMGVPGRSVCCFSGLHRSRICY